MRAPPDVPDADHEQFGILLSPDQRWALSRPTDLSRPPAVATAASQAPGARIPAETGAVSAADSAALLRGGPPARGATGGATVVEFADFECPYCQREANALTQMRRRGVKFRLVWRQFPLAIHPWAEKAAELSVCAAQQSQAAFWHLHDYLFAHQTEIDPGNLEQKATETLPSGAPRSQLLACAAGPGARAQVAGDIALGKKLGVSGTPTLFVNGTAVVGARSEGELQAIVAPDRKLQ